MFRYYSIFTSLPVFKMIEVTKKIKSIIPSIKTKHLCGVEPAVLFVIKYCCQHFKSSDSSPPKLAFLIQSSLDRMHERLNMGHWKNVPLNDRRSITVLCFFKVLALLESNNSSSDNLINGAFQIIDNGLLFGAPLAEAQGDLLHQCANLLSLWKLQRSGSDNIADCLSSKVNENQTDVPNKHSTHTLASVCCASEADWEDMTSISSNSAGRNSSHQFNFGIALKKDICPSMETFNWQYFASKTPVVLLDCITHWPAMKLWPDMNYILNKAGHRTVPIELGSKYTDKDWTQKLMTVKEFIQTQILSKQPTIGYLAQHQLFNQISELAADIKEPEYCCLREDDSLPEEETDVNAWFGPSGTISPLHFDPKHNLLAQVVGEKLVILFSPQDTSYLYCHLDNLLRNTAQVDPTQPDLELYPEFKNATPHFCILKPGEMLYIPPDWWHYVKSLSVSFSVSFWWK